MASRVVSCPNCGGAVEFKAGSSLLSVCAYCASAVARIGDDVGELEVLGKVAPLADLGSPLSLGLSGRWGKLGFTLLGQVQYDHGSGPWNEWYAAFDDGRWGWVAEAQGRVYVTFGQEVPGLPSFAEAAVGSRFTAGQHTLTIVEKKTARFLSATGEVPFALPPGASHAYCDLQGGRGIFGTIDYGADGGAERLFLGHQLEYEQLFDKSALREVTPGQAAAAVGLNCPNCGAGVDLRAPDEALRVTCGACGALLDCDKGELSLLRSKVPRLPPPLFPLGSQGRIGELTWTVYGRLAKSVRAYGEVYPWTEYLLRHPTKGWRWLVEADGHFGFVEPIDAGDVSAQGARVLNHDKTHFLRFSSASAVVDGLEGEFYWKVAVGDTVGATDYVRPPFMISEERTAEEIHYSKIRYLEPKEVKKAFALASVPPREGIAPHQPNPHARPLRRMLATSAVLTAALLALGGGRALIAKESEVGQVFASFAEKAGAKKPFEIDGEALPPIAVDVPRDGNLAITVEGNARGGTLFLSGQLRPSERGSERKVAIQLDPASRKRAVYLGQVPAGTYQLTLAPVWFGPSGGAPSAIQVRVLHDVFIGSHLFGAAALLWILPVIGAFRFFGFEKRRWSESDLSE